MSIRTRATIDDLYLVEGKAELVYGEMVPMAPSSDGPHVAGGGIVASWRAYTRHTCHGKASTDGAGFHVQLPNRASFSPDAAYHIGQRTGRRFLEGAPVCAVAVRSAYDDGRATERDMAAKRADYCACGTLVVWDVDLLSEHVITSYTARDPDNPVLFKRGEMAHAEPAVPGWRMAVDDLLS